MRLFGRFCLTLHQSDSLETASKPNTTTIRRMRKRLYIWLFTLSCTMQTAWAGSFQFFVYTLWGETYTIDTNTNDTIEEIKAKIQDKAYYDLPYTLTLESFYLTRNGKILNDGRTVGDYEILKEETLYMVSIDVTPTISLVGHEAEEGEYWTTFFNDLDFAWNVSESTRVFTVHLDGTSLTVTEVEDGIIMPNQGVVLKNMTDGNITLTPTDQEATESYYAENSLVGTLHLTRCWPAMSNIPYVLNYKPDTGVGFYKMKTNESGYTYIDANKAYLRADSEEASARAFFAFGNNTAGISATTTAQQDSHDTYYDLQGRRVVHPTKGIYVMRSANGLCKKFFLK